ncbi:hypothetical protein [Bacillus sp. 3G2]|uniref:hypothetical protein n=1 Tax=Bacillus sp. 3G2 TaxID=3375707 RepID=UPI003786FB8E
MNNILKFELKRSFTNYNFIIIFVLLTLYGLYNIFFQIIPVSKIQFMTVEYNTPTYLWLNTLITDMFSRIFLFLTPIIAVLPFSWSYGSDYSTNYVYFIYSRSKKINYIFSKFIATFLSGGVLFVYPFILQFIILTCLYPNWPSYYGTYPIPSGSMLIDLLYTNPNTYVSVYFLLMFLYAGLFAVIGLIIGLFVSKKFVICLVPFLLWIFSSIVLEFTGFNYLSPERFLRPTGISGSSLIFVISLWIILMSICFGLFLKVGTKRELV